MNDPPVFFSLHKAGGFFNRCKLSYLVFLIYKHKCSYLYLLIDYKYVPDYGIAYLLFEIMSNHIQISNLRKMRLLIFKHQIQTERMESL